MTSNAENKPLFAAGFAIAAVIVATATVNAGFYDPFKLTSPLVGVDGPRALPWELYRDRLSDVLRLGDPVQPSKLRLDAIKRRDELLARGRSLSVDELSELGLLQWRLREPEKALDTLMRAKGADPRSFWPLANLGALFFATGQLQEAESHQGASLAAFPSPWPGKPAEGVWYWAVEKAQLQLNRSRLAETGARPANRSRPVLEVDPLFPVRFVGPSGEYEAGKIADAERDKLPPNAIALVQQLLLWFPEDTRLLWLLGELYNATGDLRAADQVFDDCVGSRRFESPTLREHRRKVKAALAAQSPVATPAESFLPNQITFWTVILLIGGVILALILLQVREIRKRFRGGSDR